LLIFVLIWAASLDEHLLFWWPVTVLYSVVLLFDLCCLHSWLNKLIELIDFRRWRILSGTVVVSLRLWRRL